MSISTVITALQAKNAAITGITSAPTAMPAALNTAAMPIALVFPGVAQWSSAAIGLNEVVRTYIVRVYVEPVGQGQGVDEGFQAAAPIMDAIGTAYLADPTLGGAITHFNSISDMGLDGVLMFAGNTYRGFEFQVSVTSKW
jgi:hypothetical protein